MMELYETRKKEFRIPKIAPALFAVGDKDGKWERWEEVIGR